MWQYLLQVKRNILNDPAIPPTIINLRKTKHQKERNNEYRTGLKEKQGQKVKFWEKQLLMLQLVFSQHLQRKARLRVSIHKDGEGT